MFLQIIYKLILTKNSFVLVSCDTTRTKFSCKDDWFLLLWLTIWSIKIKKNIINLTTKTSNGSRFKSIVLKSKARCGIDSWVGARTRQRIGERAVDWTEHLTIVFLFLSFLFFFMFFPARQKILFNFMPPFVLVECNYINVLNGKSLHSIWINFYQNSFFFYSLLVSSDCVYGFWLNDCDIFFHTRIMIKYKLNLSISYSFSSE